MEPFLPVKGVTRRRERCVEVAQILSDWQGNRESWEEE